MRHIFCLVLIGTLYLAGLSPCLAQAEDFRPQEIKYAYFNSAEDLEYFFKDRTFWNHATRHRYYFGADGSFAYQYFNDYKTQKAGDILEGTWEAKAEDELCWKFQGEGGVQYETLCFDVKLAPEKKAQILYYRHPVYLFFQNDPERKASLYLNKMIPKRLLLSKEGLENYYQDIEDLKAVRDQALVEDAQAIPFADINALSDDMKSYYRDISEHVLATPLDYLVFHPDGRMVIISKEHYDVDPQNSDYIKERANYGVWFFKDNKHCWKHSSIRRPNYRALCHSVYKDKGLDKPFKGYLTHMSDGYSRLFQDDTIIPLDRMPNSDVFQADLYQ